MCLRALLAAVAVSATAAADEITLIPAQPVAPTRTQLLEMEAAAYEVEGGYLAAPGSAEACRRAGLVDGNYLRTLHAVRCRFRQGVAMPIRCSCWAAELNFFFGGCQAYFTPAWECTRCSPLGRGQFGPIHYAPGSYGTAPQCHSPVSGLPVSR